jgi:hypothetical protein
MVVPDIKMFIEILKNLKDEETSVELEDSGDSARPIAKCRRKKIQTRKRKEHYRTGETGK